MYAHTLHIETHTRLTTSPLKLVSQLCVGVLSLTLWACGDPPPPCPEEHKLEGELPPTDEVELAKRARDRFDAACTIPGPHGRLRDGFHKTWFRGGKVLKSHYTYLGGIRHGEYKLYYVSGVLRESGEYRFGLKHGRFKTFHSNGKPHLEGLYQDGRKSGDFTITSDNSMHIEKGPFFLDQRHGKWTDTFVSLNGVKQTRLVFYHEGRVVIGD